MYSQDLFNESTTRAQGIGLLSDLAAILRTGNFTINSSTANVTLPTAPMHPNSLSLPSLSSGSSDIPIISAMNSLSLDRVSPTSTFLDPSVYPVNVDRYCVVSAINPLAVKSRGANSELARKAQLRANNAIEATIVSVGFGQTPASDRAADVLFNRIRASCKDTAQPFNAWRNVLLCNTNPFTALPIATINALSNVYDVISTAATLDSIETKQKV